MSFRKVYFSGSAENLELTERACRQHAKESTFVDRTEKGLSISGPNEEVRELIADTESVGLWTGQRNASPMNLEELEAFFAYPAEVVFES